ncbi:MAG: hypothetical protein ACK4FF_04805 [Limnobacter sp.]|uniref:hypothetical protein n=1 Tax=Limnobacter sp. TaxID=2003368 RepID=UPI00391C755A
MLPLRLHRRTGTARHLWAFVLLGLCVQGAQAFQFDPLYGQSRMGEPLRLRAAMNWQGEDAKGLQASCMRASLSAVGVNAADVEPLTLSVELENRTATKATVSLRSARGVDWPSGRIVLRSECPLQVFEVSWTIMLDEPKPVTPPAAVGQQRQVLADFSWAQSRLLNQSPAQSKSVTVQGGLKQARARPTEPAHDNQYKAVSPGGAAMPASPVQGKSKELQAKTSEDSPQGGVQVVAAPMSPMTMSRPVQPPNDLAQLDPPTPASGQSLTGLVDSLLPLILTALAGGAMLLLGAWLWSKRTQLSFKKASVAEPVVMRRSNNEPALYEEILQQREQAMSSLSDASAEQAVDDGFDGDDIVLSSRPSADVAGAPTPLMVSTLIGDEAHLSGEQAQTNNAPTFDLNLNTRNPSLVYCLSLVQRAGASPWALPPGYQELIQDRNLSLTQSTGVDSWRLRIALGLTELAFQEARRMRQLEYLIVEEFLTEVAPKDTSLASLMAQSPVLTPDLIVSHLRSKVLEDSNPSVQQVFRTNLEALPELCDQARTVLMFTDWAEVIGQVCVGSAGSLAAH